MVVGVIPCTLPLYIAHTRIAFCWSVLYVTLIPENVHNRHVKPTQDGNDDVDANFTASLFLALEQPAKCGPILPDVCDTPILYLV